MADTPKTPTTPVAPADEPVVVERNQQIADVGTPTPEPLRELAEDLPERDEVQVAVKAAMLAETAQQEAKEKAKVVDASPNADDTPSGYALKKVTGISNDTKRGEKYLEHKTAKRWGYVPADL
jgi:hypothetical protein